MPKVNRWATLAASCIVQTSSGLSYSFSILAPTFKSVFGFSEMQLSTLAGGLNLGGYFAILSGHVYDQLQSRHNLGPRAVMWVGCVLMLFGYGGMWVQATFLVQPSFQRMLVCCLIAGNAGTWWDTSILATNVRNFPDDRGSVLGILKAFLGLSTSVYASLYYAAFASPSPATTHSSSHLLASIPAGDEGVTQRLRRAVRLLLNDEQARGPLAFLGMIAVVPSLLNLVASLFINQVPSEYHEHETAPSDVPPADPAHPPVNKSARFTAMYCLVGVLAILQAATTLAGQGQGSEAHEVYALVLLALLALVLLLPVSAGPLIRQSLRYRRRRAQAPLLAHASPDNVSDGDARDGLLKEDAEEEASDDDTSDDEGEERHVLLARQGDAERGQGGHAAGTASVGGDQGAASQRRHDPPAQVIHEAPPMAVSLAPDQALLRGDFWLLFLVFTSGCACGLSMLNNLTALVISLGGHKGDQVAYVSLFSVGNATGRLLFGHLSEHFLHKARLPRPAFLVLAAGIMSVSMLVLTLGSSLSSLHLLALVVGLSFGGHWSVIPAIATDLFGLKYFAGIYCMLQAAPAVGALLFASYLVGRLLTEETKDTLECLGTHCFAQAWRLLSGLNMLSVGCGVCLLMRTKLLYRPHQASS